MNTKLIRYRYLWKWLHEYRRTLATVLLSSLLVTFLGMNWPFVYRYIINQVFYDKSLDKLNFILVVYALLFVTEKILQLTWRLADAVIVSDFLYSIRDFVRLLMAVIYIYLINRLTAVFIIILVIVNYFLSAYLKKKFMVHFKA